MALTRSWEGFGGAASSPLASCLTDIDSAHIQRSQAVLVVVKGAQGEGRVGGGGGGGEEMRKGRGRRSGRRREREEGHGDTYLYIHAYRERRIGK